ncbi:MAG: PilZ domain-containing protein [Candidatus Koribacter versatilis]|uniref:PilZ domain-containing protein n=1 Tax=Candidatus Korobacter versatilis TaxID=658062 RepID=A0A932EP72_9BACT|nr:PilZ domain-containing protein [Candidatus Koribacter versatilis]
MTAAPGTPSPKQAPARVALFHIDTAAETVLRDGFRQFNIDTVHLDGEITTRLWKEKFEACVVPLDHEDANKILEAARTSPSNRRLVIYAIAADSAETLRFSKHGLNVVLPRPIERQSVLRAVRASHLLVLHELRRYVRVPVVVEVKVESERGAKYIAVSQEVSGGGMSLSTSGKPNAGDNVTVTFALPNGKQMISRGIICWARAAEGRPEEMLFGVRFHSDDDRRLAVREWIEAYLDM